MKNAILKVLGIFLVMVIITGLLVFVTPLGKTIADVMSKPDPSNANIITAQGILFMLNLMLIFGILGFIVAGQKKKNRLLWTVLCVIFNFWAFLILTFLPPQKEQFK